MTTPAMPTDLREVLEGLDGAIAALDEMPLDYQKQAFLFIERADNALVRNYRVDNFAEVVRFFGHDSRP